MTHSDIPPAADTVPSTLLRDRRRDRPRHRRNQDPRRPIRGRRRRGRRIGGQLQRPKRQPARRRRCNLAELFARIGGGTVAQVYAGAGGIDTDADAEALAALIAPHVPGARITVVHDSRLLLAAGGASTGVAVIGGTGSAAWGRNGLGEEARAGGWGYLLGDEGSGYWLGREAVRHSLRRMNQGLEPDELTTALLASCGVDDPNKLIALFHSPDTGRRYWAERARLVVDAADAGHAAEPGTRGPGRPRPRRARGADGPATAASTAR